MTTSGADQHRVVMPECPTASASRSPSPTPAADPTARGGLALEPFRLDRWPGPGARGPSSIAEGLSALYTERFGRWATTRLARRWRWQFVDNPWRCDTVPHGFVARDASRVLGMTTAYPLPLRLDGRTERGACAGDLAVVPGHPLLALKLAGAVATLRPLLGAGASEAAELVGRLSGDVLVPLSERGFALPLRTTGAIQRGLRRRLPRAFTWLGCRPVAAAASAVRGPAKPDALRALPTASQAVQRVDDFDGGYQSLWAALAERIAFGIDRTQAYMRWRYVAMPDAHHLIWAVRADDGSWRGACVAAVVHELDDRLRPCGTRGEVLELMADTDELRCDLLATAIRALAHRGVDAVHTTGLSERDHPALLAVGFAAEPETRRRLTLNRGGGASIGPDAEWYLSAADGDQLYGATR